MKIYMLWNYYRNDNANRISIFVGIACCNNYYSNSHSPSDVFASRGMSDCNNGEDEDSPDCGRQADRVGNDEQMTKMLIEMDRVEKTTMRQMMMKENKIVGAKPHQV